MEGPISRFAAAALLVAATTCVSSQKASGQDSRGARSGSSSSRRSVAKTIDARDLTTGLTLGVYTLAATGVSITGPDIDGMWGTQAGEGVGLLAGWGFDRTFSAFASLDLAKQATTDGTVPAGTYGLAHFEVGGRANIPTGNAKTVPYVTASIGNRALAASGVTDDDGLTGNLTISGHVFVVGVGVQHFLSPHVALDVGMETATGKLSHFDDPGGPYERQVNSSTSTRLRVGMNWRP